MARLNKQSIKLETVDQQVQLLIFLSLNDDDGNLANLRTIVKPIIVDNVNVKQTGNE